jgi:uncharacterized phage protein gp47/JayE
MADGPVLDYTNRDYASILAALLDEAQRRLPEWTDRSENDPGRVLLDLFAYAADIMLYYQDRIANESFLATARERESIIDLLRLIGYELRTAAPAAAELVLTAKNDQAKTILINPGARFATLPPTGGQKAVFTYVGIKALPMALDGKGGLVTAKLPVLHATWVQNEKLGTTDGSLNQRFKLAQGPVLVGAAGAAWDKMAVLVDEGGGPKPWTRRENLLYSGPDDAHYMVRVDGDGRATVYFGDNRFGRAPVAGTVTASYLTGGGSAGNVGPTAITKVESGVSEPNAVSVTNPLAASGGAEPETLEEARFYGPPIFRSLGRAVTADDYAALASDFPGVARARPVVRGWNHVDVYVLPKGGLPLTDDLRQKVQAYLDERKMATVMPHVREPLPAQIHIKATVQVLPTYFTADVKARVTEAVAALFSPDRASFGTNVYLSKVYEAIEGVDGVDYVTVTDFVRGGNSSGMAKKGIIEVRENEVPQMGTLGLTMQGGVAS